MPTPYPGLGSTPLDTNYDNTLGESTTINANFGEPEELKQVMDDAGFELELSTSRNNPNYDFQPVLPPAPGSMTEWERMAIDQRNKELDFSKQQADDNKFYGGLQSAANAKNYAGLGAALGSMDGKSSAAAGMLLGTGLDLVMGYFDQKKQKRLMEEQRRIQKRMEQIENAERLRQRQLSNFELGMRASDKSREDELLNAAEALKFKRAMDTLANQKMARMGMNIYGQNGYQSADFGIGRTDPNRVYRIAEQTGVNLAR